MLNPKYKRYSDRLQELIEEGNGVIQLEKPSSRGGLSIRIIQGVDRVKLQSWLVKVSNIIRTVFGQKSSHQQHLTELTKAGIGTIEYSSEIYQIIGLLDGALDDLKSGFLQGQEFIVAGEVFDSVLEQAKYLAQNHYKDPAAVLARVVLEDALKRIARGEEIDDTQKASRINDELKRIEKYPQPQWRQIQAWLDIGNAAAHGDFGNYNEEDVLRLIDDIGRFLAMEFHS